jgi:hypothetical protein
VIQSDMKMRVLSLNRSWHALAACGLGAAFVITQMSRDPRVLSHERLRAGKPVALDRFHTGFLGAERMNIRLRLGR